MWEGFWPRPPSLLPAAGCMNRRVGSVHRITLPARIHHGRQNSGDIIPISQLCLPEWPWVRQSAVFSGIPVAEGLFEKRCRAVCFVNIETGRLVSFVNFEDGRAIKQGAIHLESPIPKVGLEPTPPLRGPGFESGASAISVALETGWADN